MTRNFKSGIVLLAIVLGVGFCPKAGLADVRASSSLVFTVLAPETDPSYEETFENASVASPSQVTLVSDGTLNKIFQVDTNGGESPSSVTLNGIQAIQGAKDLKLDINFDSGWGALLLMMAFDSTWSTQLPFDVTLGQTLSLHAGLASAGAVEMAIGLGESDGDVWVSQRATLSGQSAKYNFGVNTGNFTLETASSLGNGQFEPRSVKTILLYVYKGNNTGTKTVYLDAIAPDNYATGAPTVQTLTVEAPITRGTFTVTANISNLNGLDLSILPSLSLTPQGGSAIPLSVQTYSPGVLVATGSLPGILATTGTLALSGVKDVAGNTSETMSVDLAINGMVATLNAFLDSAGLVYVNTPNNTFSAANGTLTMALDFAPTNNWGAGVLIPVSNTLRANFSKYRQIAYSALAASPAKSLKTRLVLSELDGEAWVQADSYHVSSDLAAVAGVDLIGTAFVQDKVNGATGNQQLDLDTVSYVQVQVLRGNEVGNPSVAFQGFQLRADDIVPPAMPMFSGFSYNATTNSWSSAVATNSTSISVALPSDATAVSWVSPGTSTVNVSNGVASIQLSQIPDGLLALQLSAVDASGNVSLPAVASLLVDATPPTSPVAVNGPAVNWLSNRLSISGTVDVKTVLVHALLNGNLVATSSVSPSDNGTFALSGIPIVVTQNVAQLIAYDSLGRASDPTNLSFAAPDNVIVMNFDGGVDHSKTQVVDLGNEINLLNFTTTSSISVVEGSLKMALDFGQGQASELNWGAMLMAFQPNESVSYALDAARYQTVSLSAKSASATDNLEIAIGLSDGKETWVSSKVRLTNSYANYGFGLNTSVFSLDAFSAPDNKIFEPEKTKYIFVYVYKNGLVGNHTAFFDLVQTALDTALPIVSAITLPTTRLPLGTFTATASVSDLGGLDYSVTPSVALVVGNQSLPLGVASYADGQLVFSGVVPNTILSPSGQLVISGAKDRVGNRSSISSTEVQLGLNEVALNPFLGGDGIGLINTQNTLSVTDGVLHLGLLFDHSSSANYNWGSGALVPVPAYLQDNLVNYAYLAYQISNDINDSDLRTRLVLSEKDGDVWVQKDLYSLSTGMSTAGAKLSSQNFLRDTAFVSGNGILDFNNLSYVQVQVVRGETDVPAQGTFNVAVQNLVLRTQNIIPPTSIGIVSTKIYSKTPTISVPVILPSGFATLLWVSDAKLDHLDTTPTTSQLVLSLSQEGSYGVTVSAVDADGNVSLPVSFTWTYDQTPPEKPFVFLESATSNVTHYDVPIAVSSDTDHVVVLMNGVAVTTNAILVMDNVTSANGVIHLHETLPQVFVIQGLSLSGLQTQIVVQAVDAAGNVAQSDPVNLSLEARTGQIDPAVVKELKNPIFFKFPIGSQASDSVPEIRVVPQAEVVAPPSGFSISSDLIDISLPDHLTDAVWLSFSIPDDILRPAAWYYDPNTKKWSQDGISNAFIETKLVDDGTGEKPVRYLTFQVSHFSIFGVMATLDNNAPSISDFKIDGKRVYARDYISDQPVMTVTLTEDKLNDSGIATYNISVLEKISGQTTATVLATFDKVEDTPIVGETLVTYNVLASSGKTLKAGAQYSFVLTVTDAQGLTTTNATEYLRVNPGLDVTDVLNGPNPFNPNKESTTLQYQLTKNSKIKITLYTITGDKVWSRTFESGNGGGTTGFNAVTWDGRNDFGEIVSSGIYIAYVVAEDGSTRKVAKLKMAVLK